MTPVSYENLAKIAADARVVAALYRGRPLLRRWRKHESSARSGTRCRPTKSSWRCSAARRAARNSPSAIPCRLDARVVACRGGARARGDPRGDRRRERGGAERFTAPTTAAAWGGGGAIVKWEAWLQIPLLRTVQAF